MIVKIFLALIKVKRPLHNTPFCPITTSGSNFNPRNTQCIPAVKIIAFLVLGQNWAFFKGLIVTIDLPWLYETDRRESAAVIKK